MKALNTQMRLPLAINFKVFFIGLTLTALFYGVLYGYLLLNKKSTIQDLEQRLATKSIDITRGTVENVIVDTETSRTISKDLESTANSEPPDSRNVSKPSGNKISIISELHIEERMHTLPFTPQGQNITPFQAYSKNVAVPENAAGVYAFIFTDFGLSAENDRFMLSKFDSRATIVLSPYADNPASSRNSLGEDGYETWIQIPLETNDFPEVDPGPQALLSRSTFDYNRDRFYSILGLAQGYAGVVAYKDRAFEKARPTIGALTKDLFDRGLGYISINTKASNQVSEVALKNDGVYGRASLNFKNYESAPQNEFVELAKAILENKKEAIFVFPTNRVGIETAHLLQNEIKQLGAVFVPASFILKNDITSNDVKAISDKNQ